MGEEAAAPLLVRGNDGDDLRLDLTHTIIHGDGDDQRKAAGEAASSATSRHAVLGWDWAEVTGQLGFAAPMVATSMAYYAIPLVSVMFAGRLGDLQLAAATLGNSWGTVTGIALMTGLSGSLETLCGQGYGARAYRTLGVHLQASLLTSALASAVVSLLWLYSEPLLVFLGQDPETSRLAADFLRHSVPALLAYGFIQCALRFLQAQSVVAPLVAFSLLPLAARTSASPTRSSTFEYWSFEILVLFAGLMPESQLSTSIIAMCQNTEAISYMITYGFAAVISTRVSNELGARNIANAKKALTVSLALSLMLGVVFLLLLGLGHELWARLFSSSKAVVSAFASMTPLLIGSVVLDSTQGVLSGVARGCGWQHLAAWTNLVAFYVIGLPLAILFGFTLGLQTKGLWMGQICGLLCQNCVLFFITLRTNWEELDLTMFNKDNDFVC
ncbi:unnamed protein product [Miscanthus lutarioriparius]|uniref:Protein DETOXIFICATION n=1 Tax=Miscanthus lutarioriparius TaxID=422564 RepID=A0A811NT40_9POAL|nr:unnamed protein product [Miscanthus lutarioriparius]